MTEYCIRLLEYCVTLFNALVDIKFKRFVMYILVTLTNALAVSSVSERSD